MKTVRVSISDSEPSRSEGRSELLREPVAEVPDFDLSPIQFHIHVSATRDLGTVASQSAQASRYCGASRDRAACLGAREGFGLLTNAAAE